MLLEALPVIGNLFTKIIDVVDKSIADKDLATKLKSELMATALQQDYKIDEKRADVIMTEMKGASWIQQSWRPILMLTIVLIIFNNYVLFPYLHMFTEKAVMLELPTELYTLLTVGVGGYIVGRSGEKIAQEWRK